MAPVKPKMTKLSLVGQFDDLCRHLAPTDTTIEETFLESLKNQEECRKRWLATELENQELKKHIASLREEQIVCERNLANAREVLQKEVHRREKIEEEKQNKQHQLDLIRDFIMNDTELRDETIEKLAFLKPENEGKDFDANRLGTINESIGSVLSPSGDSLEISDNGTCRRSSRSRVKRRSNAVHPGERVSPVKKTKGYDEVDQPCANVITTTVTIKDGKDFVATSRVFTQPSTPAPSVPPPTSPEADQELPKLISGKLWYHMHVHHGLLKQKLEEINLGTLHQHKGQRHKEGADRTNACVPRQLSFSCSAPTTPVSQRRGRTATPKRSHSAGRLMSREHTFCPKTVIKSETCGPCGKRIKFYRTAYKCNRCRSVCHPECRDKVPLPCFPTSQTPTQGGTAGCRGSLSDYVPSTPPMVPALVIHCIQEVEKRGLHDVGLYRIPGSEREVRELREQFERGKGIPNMSRADIHAVCGVLKDFLRSLRECLITKSLWQTFVDAAQLKDGNRMCATWEAIQQLPQPNRDTLAALMLHLKNVACHEEVKMPVTNLARVFAPTIVGFSTADTAAVTSLLAETELQTQVMLALFAVPEDYWEDFLDVESDDEIRTPKPLPVPSSKLLGPIYDCGSNTELYTPPYKRTPASCSRLTSSASAKNQRNLTKGPPQKRTVFYSPIMK
ncbi:rac GTPase-activating protein 1-like isoform X2 [Amblyomma americanum]